MCINLRGGHALMTQQLPYTLQLGTVVQHGRGKRMPQDVRGAFLHGRHHGKIMLDDGLHLTTCNATAFVIQYQGLFQPHRLLITQSDIFHQRLLQLLAKGYDTLFVSFARDLQLVRGEVNVLIVQPHQLCQSDARLIRARSSP